MKRICVQPSFVLLLVIMIALGYQGQFFVIFLAVTLHEAAHIAVALYFKLEFKKIIITPIGEIAVIDSLNSKFHKKLLTVIAGPLSSAILSFIAYCFFPNAKFFALVNLSICIFNLLPVCPLDGGRIFYMFLSLKTGNLSAGKITSKMAKVLSSIIILLGLLQIVLFPYNMSLFCVGIYLYRNIKKEHMYIVFEFYREMASGTRDNIMLLRHYQISLEMPVKDIVEKICFDRYCIFCVTENGILMYTLSQQELMAHILNEGLCGTVSDIYCF